VSFSQMANWRPKLTAATPTATDIGPPLAGEVQEAARYGCASARKLLYGNKLFPL
jgi:hypothetical protein